MRRCWRWRSPAAATFCRRPRRLAAPAAIAPNPAFVGHAFGYAFTLGALLVFVFGAPSVFVNALGYDLAAFVALQCSGILCFALAAAFTGHPCDRYSARRVIRSGSLLTALGATALLGYGLAGGTRIVAIIALLTIVNTGLGLRGAPGFHAALKAAAGDDARASALIVLAILGTAALGTAAIAPFIGYGLTAIAAGATLLAWSGLLVLGIVPGCDDRAGAADRDGGGTLSAEAAKAAADSPAR